MPLWRESRAEWQRSQAPDGRPDFDRVQRQYRPQLLFIRNETSFCKLSKEGMKTWLKPFMFQYKPKVPAVAAAQKVAEWLSRRDDFKIHERYIPRSALEERDMS